MKIRQIFLVLITVAILGGCAVHGHGHRAHAAVISPQPKVVVRVAPVVHCNHRYHHHRC